MQNNSGITGGFAPPTPSAVHQMTRSSAKPETLAITSLTRADGTPDLAPAMPKSLQVDDHAALIDELHGILKELPTESPPGSQDIYGLDTTIAWGSSDLEWMNGGPGGCGNGTSEVQATDAQKAKFKRAVDIVSHLATSA
ncbi:hypothetical protein DL93DRAFT_2090959 [Clavulina sp. PMI_390]|nr:hypothetical protein DL93DRAFT_2090959 [Clavulina sp. PMI_390]